MLAKPWPRRLPTRVVRLPIRSYVARSRGENQSELLTILQRNPELGEDEARNELRWIIEETSAPEQVAALVVRRARGEPLQYILGTTDFGPLTLRCREPVLIPRPETAYIFERYARLLRDAGDGSVPGKMGNQGPKVKVLDLCTGSGCIPLLLSHLLPDRLDTPLGVDISPDAIGLARENATSLRLPLDLLQADLWGPYFFSHISGRAGKVDVLVSNPPYIPLHEYRQLPSGVREWEDRRALLDDPGGSPGDGLRFYRRIASLVPSLLRPRIAGWKESVPRVVLEIGHTQGPDVAHILQESAHGRVARTEVWKDQYERDRAVVAWIS